MTKTLRDFGEREIVRSILPRYATGVGSDCALVKTRFAELCVTTDPVPSPAAKVIGGDGDLYWMGWLSVIINASDLAAAGSMPIAFVAAIDAPGSLAISDFERLLAGIKDANDAEGLQFVGGNLRESDRITVVGTAIGGAENGRSLSRCGANAGDLILSIGAGGVFWRDALAWKGGVHSLNKKTSPLFSPRSQSKVMHHLAMKGNIAAAMDNSDGLLPSLQQLAESNGLIVELDLELLTVDGADVYWQGSKVEKERLWLGWGDWNVIVAVREPNIDGVCRCVAELGGIAQIVGKCIAGEPAVLVRRNKEVRKAPRLESERFCVDSWFSTGIEGYINQLCTVGLP